MQALRAVAALIVVGAHICAPNGTLDEITGSAGAWSPLGVVGTLGVDLFFVVSGFMMVTTTRSYEPGARSAGIFALRRIARLYPPYLTVTLAAYAVWLWAPGMLNGSQTVKPDPVASFLLLPQAGLPLVLVTWTLVYDVFFYAVFAVSLLLGRPWLRAAIFGAWGVFVLAAQAFPPVSPGPWLAVATSPLALHFLIGIAVAYATQVPVGRPGLVLVAGTGVAVVAVLVAHATWGSAADDHHQLWRALVLGAAMAAVVWGAVGVEFSGWTAPGWLVALGGWSYSLFLAHIAALKAVEFALQPLGLPDLLVTQAFVLAGAVVASLAAGYALHRVVERPGIKYLHDRIPRPARRVDMTPAAPVRPAAAVNPMA